MKTIILFAIITSLFCCGLYTSTLKGMILNKPAIWIKNNTSSWLYKPICGCLICMSSYWSIVIYCWFGFFLKKETIFYLPILIPIVAGLNAIILSIISNILPDEETD